VIAAVLVLALLGAWQAYVDLGGVDALLLPAPTQIAQSLWDDRAMLASNLAVTAEEVALGLAVALVVALACALAIHMSSALRRTVMPLLVASQTIPVVIVAPLLVFWFGFGAGPKTAIVALVTFFPIVVTTLDGLAGVDPALRKLLRSLGASRWQALRHVEAPTALPSLLSGAKIAVAVAVIGAVLAEQSGSEAGLGHLITQGSATFQTARAYAAVVLLSALAIALFAALALAERRLAPWAHRTRTAGGPPR
jgi:putative hydroxymethylpyrimidine transport system permease protein